VKILLSNIPAILLHMRIIFSFRERRCIMMIFSKKWLKACLDLMKRMDKIRR